MYQELSKSWKYLEANEALGSLHSNWRRQTRGLGSGYTIHIHQLRILDKQLHVFIFPSRFYLKLSSLGTWLGWFGSLRLPPHPVAMLWVQQGVPGAWVFTLFPHYQSQCCCRDSCVPVCAGRFGPVSLLLLKPQRSLCFLWITLRCRNPREGLHNFITSTLPPLVFSWAPCDLCRSLSEVWGHRSSILRAADPLPGLRFFLQAQRILCSQRLLPHFPLPHAWWENCLV